MNRNYHHCLKNLLKPFKDYTHPNPLTYLNQERWKDEVKPKEEEKPKSHRGNIAF